MPDNKKYYYLKLKENFFDSDALVVLESQKDGYLYSNILLKMYLKSLKNDGRLAFNEVIPYNVDMLATLTRHQVGTVEKALNMFEALGLIEVLDNGVIYMMDIQNYIGRSSTEADRQREYQKRIFAEKNHQPALCESSNNESNVKSCKKSNNISNNESNKIFTPEIELEKEIEIELDREKDIDYCAQSAPTKKPHKKKYGAYNHVRLTDEEFNRLVEEYGEAITTEYIKKVDEYCELKGAVYKNHNLAIRNFLKRDNVKKKPQTATPFDSGLKNQPPKPQEPELQPDFVPDPDDPFNDYWEV